MEATDSDQAQKVLSDVDLFRAEDATVFQKEKKNHRAVSYLRSSLRSRDEEKKW